MTDIDAERDTIERYRRQRVNELSSDVAACIHTVMVRLEELDKEFDIPAVQGLRLGADRLSDDKFRAEAIRLLESCWFRDPASVENDDDHPMHALIDRLLGESPQFPTKPGEPEQTPAMVCFVTLASGHQIQGSLARTSEGMIRMLMPGQDENNKPIMLEHFFDVREIWALTVRREIKATTGSKIWPG